MKAFALLARHRHDPPSFAPFLPRACLPWHTRRMAIQSFDLTTPDGLETVFFDVSNIESAANQQWGNDDSRITVKYKVLWSQRYSARLCLLGQTRRVPAAGGFGVYLSRSLPHAWIEDEAKFLYCIKITDTKGLGTQREGVTYDHAQITCVYQDLPYDVRADDDPLVAGIVAPYIGKPDEGYRLSRWIDVGKRDIEGRIIQSYGSSACYCGARDVPNSTTINTTRPVLNGRPFPFYEETITYIWHQVPVAAAPLAFASSTVNKINLTSFDIYAENTLMFIGVNIVRTRLPDQQRAYNLEYKFKYNRKGWHRLPDPITFDAAGGPRYDVVRMVSNHAVGLFETAEFATLFRPI